MVCPMAALRETSAGKVLNAARRPCASIASLPGLPAACTLIRSIASADKPLLAKARWYMLTTAAAEAAVGWLPSTTFAPPSIFLKNEGLVLNFVGDAMTAVWGAPLAVPNHAQRAARAAWQLSQSARIEVDGRILRTRVGLHTGKVLAGNVGSAKRFDYAVIGDPANLASRLEGLNKFLGTDVLISEAVRTAVADSFVTRCVGEFRVVGKKQPCVVHELLGPTPSEKIMPWQNSFARALEAFRGGDLVAAEREMQRTQSERGGIDGPSQFYLQHIARLKENALPPNWSGIVEVTEK